MSPSLFPPVSDPSDGCVDDMNLQMGGAGEGVVPGEREESEESQLHLQLKRKLQRNRTSFTQEQIDALEKGLSPEPKHHSSWLSSHNSEPSTDVIDKA